MSHHKQDLDSVAPSLVFAGTHERDSSYVKPHAHPCPELILVDEGTCDVTAEGAVIHASAGDLIAMPARNTHDQTSEGKIRTYYLGFIEHRAMRWIKPQVVTLSSPSFFHRCMHLISDIHLRKVSASDAACNSLIVAILEQLEHHHLQNSQEASMPSSLRAALRYIDDHFEQPLTIDGIAEHTRMSASSLYLLFRTHLNTSPMKYLHEQRMLAARAALENPYTLIKEVAATCGYSNVNYFVRTFRKSHGVSPGEWRRSHPM